jgi:amino acid transporter
MQALAERGMGPKQLAYVDKKGRPLYGVGIQLLFGLLAFIGESNKQDIVFNWLLALSGLSFFFIWAAICLSHIRFRHAWKVQGHIKAELPYEAMFGVMGSWYGLILNILCMTATFYVALFVSFPILSTVKQSTISLPGEHETDISLHASLSTAPQMPKLSSVTISQRQSS